MSGPITDSPAETVITLLQLSRVNGEGGITSYNYCSGASPLTVGATEFLPLPTLEYELEPNEGCTQTWEGRLTLRKVQPFIDALAGIPMPDIEVELAEVIPGSDESTTSLFAGTVSGVLENVDGQGDLIEVAIESLLARGNAALGISATQKCAWRLGDEGCGKDLTGLKPTVTISAISGYDVTLTGLTPTDQPRRFERGFLVIDGAPVLIRGYTTGTTVTLGKRLPASLVGAAAVAVPGCDGRPTTCRDRWDNEEFFLGLGLVIPARDPQYQAQ